MAHAHLAELRQVGQVQALGEQLAVDEPLAAAGVDAVANPAGQLLERGTDERQRMRIQKRGACAGHYP